MADLKYEKPKILLVDLPSDALTRLQAAGLNARAGSFGSPYSVKVSSHLEVVPDNHRLPNFSEQEILVIDLTPPPALDNSSRYSGVGIDVEGIYAVGDAGVVDPRPRSMKASQELADRVLDRQGLFVVFAEPRRVVEYHLARYRAEYTSSSGQFHFDNWCFLSVLESQTRMQFSADSGNEIKILEPDNAIFKVVQKYLEGSSFTSTIRSQYTPDKTNWAYLFRPLLVNKHGEVVGGVLFEKGKRGAVILLPQIKDKARFLEELFRDVLPAEYPHFFPFHGGKRWLEKLEYEHPAVLRLKEHQLEIQRKADEKKAEVDEEIAAERMRLGFLHGLLTKSGDELVGDVKAALEFIGFEKVIDVDVEELRANKQEDLRVEDRSTTLIFEVKGLTWLPRESNTLQVTKFVARRSREWQRFNVHGVTLINHQKGVLPLERDERNVFTDAQIKDAEHHESGLMTTWDLFRLIRGMERWRWDPRVIRDIFYQTGRIGRLPSHYRHIGEIAHFYDKAKVASVQLAGEFPLCVRDTVGYVYPGGFEEEEIRTLQVDHERVEEAKPGQKAGYITRMERSQLPNGTTVYLIGGPV